MADTVSSAQRSRIMAAVRSRGNRTTEMVLVAAFRKAKVTGWRRHFPIIGKPDFVFPRARVAVFVDGCFWHGCPQHRTYPVRNASFWLAKVEGNMARDRRVSRKLRAQGWKVLRIWEHDLQRRPLHCLARVRRAILTDTTQDTRP